MGAVLTLSACGGEGKHKANDPSEAENKPAYEDETPKWEGASRVQDTQKSSSGGGSASSDNAGGSGSGTGSGARKVNEAPARRTDQYDKEATDVPLKRAARQVKENCGAAKDENGKATGPWGKVTIQVLLGHNGHSKEVIVPAPYNEKPSGKCIEKAFTNLTFPPWSGADTQVDQEVELVEPGKAPKK
jgi:hypothetical protein